MPPKPLPPHRRAQQSVPPSQSVMPRPQPAAPATPATVAGPSRPVGPHSAAQIAPLPQSAASATPAASTVVAAPAAVAALTRPRGQFNRLRVLPIDIGREIMRHLHPVDQYHLAEAASFGDWTQTDFAVLDITVLGQTIMHWAWANIDLLRRPGGLFLVTRKRGHDQPVVNAFISARDVPHHQFIPAESVLTANVLPRVRTTLRRLDMHGETLFDVAAVRCVLEELPNLQELRIANNSAIVPDEFLDTFLTWNGLRVLDFRPADPRQHASGAMNTVSRQYSRYFLALTVAYIPIIGRHRPNMLRPGSMFMDALFSLLRVSQLDDLINACDAYQANHPSAAPADDNDAVEYDDDGNSLGGGEDMDIEVDINVGSDMVIDSPAYKAAAHALALHACVDKNKNTYYCHKHGTLPHICFSEAERKKRFSNAPVSCVIEILSESWVSPLSAQVDEFWHRLHTQFGREQALGDLPSMPRERSSDEEHVTPYPHNPDSWNDRKFPTPLARIEGQPPVYDRDLPQQFTSRPSQASSTPAVGSSPPVQIKEPSNRLAADEPPVKPSDTAAEDVPIRNPISFAPYQDPFPQPISKDKAPAQPISKDKAPAQPLSEEKAPVQPISNDKAPVQPISNDKAPVQPISNDKAPVQPISNDKAPVQPISNDKAPVQPISNDKAPVQPISKGKATAQSLSEEKAPVQPISKGKAPAQPVSKGKAPAQVAQDVPVISGQDALPAAAQDILDFGIQRYSQQMASPANRQMAILRARILARLSPAVRALVDPSRREFEDPVARQLLRERLRARWNAESAAENTERAVVLYQAHLRESLQRNAVRPEADPEVHSQALPLLNLRGIAFLFAMLMIWDALSGLLSA